MPTVVACQCGQRFQAQDHLAGKTVRCPSCSQPLQIPAVRQPAVPAAGDDAFWGELQSPPASKSQIPQTATQPQTRNVQTCFSGLPVSGILCPCGYAGKSFTAKKAYEWWVFPIAVLLAPIAVALVLVLLIALGNRKYAACPKCGGRKFSSWQGTMTPDNEQYLLQAPAKNARAVLISRLILLGIALLGLGAALVFMFNMMS